MRQTKTIFQGDLYITDKPEIIRTVLGSCISVCLYDIRSTIVCMNHYALPKRKVDSNKQDLNYGKEAIDILIRRMMSKGVHLYNIRAKVFGGACINMSEVNSVGQANITIAFKILNEYKIPIESKDVGGINGRTLLFHTESRKVFVKRLNK
jgi:chemotaxis protein CheD